MFAIAAPWALLCTGPFAGATRYLLIFSSSQSRVKRGGEVVLSCKDTSPSLLLSHVNLNLKVEHQSVTQPNLCQLLSGLSAKCAAIKCDGCVMMFSEWSSQSHHLTLHTPARGHS